MLSQPYDSLEYIMFNKTPREHPDTKLWGDV